MRCSSSSESRTLAPAVRLAKPLYKVAASLQNPWDVSFESDHGAPAGVRLNVLSSWTQSPEPGIEYFSGTATYTTTFTVSRRLMTKGSRVRLNLGDVKDLAQVSLNGKPLGILWKKPFITDITGALKAGSNRLEIKVTNVWPNRMIGDKQPGMKQIAYSTFDPFKVDSPLLPSGLLGPVTLEAADVR